MASNKCVVLVEALHRGDDDALCCLHHPLEGLAINSGAAAVPGSDAASESALNCAPVEIGEHFGRRAKHLESPEEV